MTVRPASELRDILQSSEKIRRSIATEMTPSLPIPARVNQALVCRAFYFARAGFPPQTKFDLYPPTWFAELDWKTGEVMTVEARDPPSFGVPGSRFEPFASVSYVERNLAAKELGLGDVTQRNMAINTSYDELVPRWFAGGLSNRQSRSEFITLFEYLAEPAFAPVYQLLGTDFFSWVQQP